MTEAVLKEAVGRLLEVASDCEADVSGYTLVGPVAKLHAKHIRLVLQALSGWEPIETAPKDGREIQAHIPGHGRDNLIAWTDGLEGENGPCGGWTFTREQEPPECWTDGYCWASNEDGEPSIQPTHWRLPPAPEAIDGK